VNTKAWLAHHTGVARATAGADRTFATLTLHLADPVVAERAEELGVERQAALDRRDDEVDVVNAG